MRTTLEIIESLKDLRSRGVDVIVADEISTDGYFAQKYDSCVVAITGESLMRLLEPIDYQIKVHRNSINEELENKIDHAYKYLKTRKDFLAVINSATEIRNALAE